MPDTFNPRSDVFSDRQNGGGSLLQYLKSQTLGDTDDCGAASLK